jgi:DNA-cytosine methyltransferase
MVIQMKILRVGTDYSGMETPILALRALGFNHRHVFSSEICPKARLVIEEKFAPDVLFGDATKRKAIDLPSKLDLYVAGFPCQGFSGLSDLAGYNNDTSLKHFYACVRAIKTCRPKVFILENVPRLVTIEGGTCFKRIQQVLRRIKGYQITYMFLNAKDYGGIQNRKRLFIVGTNRGPIQKPTQQVTSKTFQDIMEQGPTREKLHRKIQSMFDRCAHRYDHPVFMSRYLTSLKCSGSRMPPTLTARGGGVYWSKKKICSTLREEMRLQGIPDSFSFPKSTSKTAAKKMVGNAMSVDVLKCLLRKVIRVL